MKYTHIILVLVCISILFPFPEPVFSFVGVTAQEVHVSGSPNPVGAGARALGMGGAFIGVADDATAASWNPGGLIQLEMPEISLVLSYDKLNEKRSFELTPGASGTQSLSLYDINYLSAAYPFTINETNMIFSLNYQTLYNFNQDHTFNYNYHSVDIEVFGPFTIEAVKSGQQQTKQVIDGYLKALSPAMAFQWTPEFSVGFAFNYFHPDLGSHWEKESNYSSKGTRTSTMTPPGIVRNYSESKTFRYLYEYTFETSANPFNFNEASYHLGFLWNISSKFTLGGVYKPGYTAKVHFKEGYEREEITINTDTGVVEKHDITPWTMIADEDQEMVMPASYGLGLTCRFSDQFTMDLDIYRTDWQDFILRQADGRELSLITGQERALADTKPTHQVRLGGEYLYLYKYKYAIPVRAGIFYDPEPTEGNPDDFYGLSLGSGIATNKFALDIAYQYRWGNDVRKVRLGTEEIFQDIKQHTVYASIIFYF